MTRVSIIIPHYNSVSLLQKLLSSIPKKQEIETIVIDDNSDEGIKEFKEIKNDPNFEHVLFLHNNKSIKGAGACRNIGLEYAKGEWLLFADSDDFFIDGFYDVIENYFDSNYDLVYFKPTSIYLDTGKKATRHIVYEDLIENYKSNNSIKNELKLRCQFPVPWSKMVKSKLVFKHGVFFDEIIAMNDIMFSTKVGYFASEIFASDEMIYCVTRNSGSLTTNMNEQIIDSRVDALIRYNRFIEDSIPSKYKKYLKFTSIYELQRIYHSGLGFSKVFWAYKKFKKNNISVIKFSMLNPLLLVKRLQRSILRIRNEKRYYEK